MDSSFAIIPYMPYHELSPNNWAPVVLFLLLLGAYLEAAPKNTGVKQGEEVHFLQEPVVAEPQAIAPPDEQPVSKKEPRPQIPGLEDIILGSLSKRTGLRAKDLVAKTRAIIPEIKKGDINSCLYKLLAKKQVVKSDDETPLWTLKK